MPLILRGDIDLPSLIYQQDNRRIISTAEIGTVIDNYKLPITNSVAEASSGRSLSLSG